MGTIQQNPLSPRNETFDGSGPFRGVDLYHQAEDVEGSCVLMADNLINRGGILYSRPGFRGMIGSSTSYDASSKDLSVLANKIYSAIPTNGRFLSDYPMYDSTGNPWLIFTAGGKIFKWLWMDNGYYELLDQNNASYDLDSTNSIGEIVEGFMYVVDGGHDPIRLNLDGGSTIYSLAVPDAPNPINLANLELDPMSVLGNWTFDGQSTAYSCLTPTGNGTTTSSWTGWNTGGAQSGFIGTGPTVAYNLGHGGSLFVPSQGNGVYTSPNGNALGLIAVPAFSGNSSYYPNRFNWFLNLMKNNIGNCEARTTVYAFSASGSGSANLLGSISTSQTTTKAYSNTWQSDIDVDECYYVFDFSSYTTQIEYIAIEVVQAVATSGDLYIALPALFPISVQLAKDSANGYTYWTPTLSGNAEVTGTTGAIGSGSGAPTNIVNQSNLGNFYDLKNTSLIYTFAETLDLSTESILSIPVEGMTTWSYAGATTLNGIPYTAYIYSTTYEGGSWIECTGGTTYNDAGDNNDYNTLSIDISNLTTAQVNSISKIKLTCTYDVEWASPYNSFGFGALYAAGNLTIGGADYFYYRAECIATASGNELVSAGWTLGSGWSGSFSSGFTHTPGNTSGLSNSFAPSAFTNYRVITTISGRTNGSVTVTFGGVDISIVYTSYTWFMTASTNGSLTISPTTDFDGNISVSIYVANVFESNPSVGSATITPTTLTASANVTLDQIVNAVCNWIRIYRLGGDNSDTYRIAEFSPSSSATSPDGYWTWTPSGSNGAGVLFDNVPDLYVVGTASVISSAHASPPADATYVKAFNGSLFYLYGGNQLAKSMEFAQDVNAPLYFNYAPSSDDNEYETEGNVFTIGADPNDSGMALEIVGTEIASGNQFGQMLAIHCKRSSHLLQGDNNGDYKLTSEPYPYGVGLAGLHAKVRLGTGGEAFMGPDRMHAFPAVQGNNDLDSANNDFTIYIKEQLYPSVPNIPLVLDYQIGTISAAARSNSWMVVFDNKIYLGSPQPGDTQNTVIWVYDLITEGWTRFVDMSISHAMVVSPDYGSGNDYGLAMLGYDGQIYTFGGNTDMASPSAVEVPINIKLVLHGIRPNFFYRMKAHKLAFNMVTMIKFNIEIAFNGPLNWLVQSLQPTPGLGLQVVSQEPAAGPGTYDLPGWLAPFEKQIMPGQIVGNVLTLQLTGASSSQSYIRNVRTWITESWLSR